MTASPDVLRILVLAATAATTVAPVLLVALFVRDYMRGQLW